MRLDLSKNSISIDFNNLVNYLIVTERRLFSAVEFEDKLKAALNIFLQKTITDELINNICKCIDDISSELVMKYQFIEYSFPREKDKKEFYLKHKREYDNALEKTRRRNPKEYELLLRKFKKRLES